VNLGRQQAEELAARAIRREEHRDAGDGDSRGGLLQTHMSTAYRYARFWAGALTVLGTLFVLVGVLLAIVLILIPTVGGWVPRRGHEVLAGVVMAVLSVLAGALLGGPLIVAGQSLRVLLAQRLLLERLNQHGARSGDQ